MNHLYVIRGGTRFSSFKSEHKLITMESSSTEFVSFGDRSDYVTTNDEELNTEEALDRYWHPFAQDILEYVELNKISHNTKLFSFLALLNHYLPESYLLQSQCQEFLGPPDPIHGGPSFEQRMEPFTKLIKTLDTSTGQAKRVLMIHPAIAQRSVQLLVTAGVTRSDTVTKLMTQFSGHQAQPDTIQFIKDLLTKREIGKRGKEKFSRLIEDIRSEENSHHSVSVLTTASNKFKGYPLFPQTLSRLYYITRRYEKAEEWAERAIQRAPLNSFVADTLGQVHKNRLLKEAWNERGVFDKADKAIKAFKAVEEKAEKEEGPEMQDVGLVSISNSFNNRGIFGCMQVAKIIFEKLTAMRTGEEWRRVLTGQRDTVCHTSLKSILQEYRGLITNLKNAVNIKFNFFECYLTYSRPDIKSLEPSYFWRDIALCYQWYNTRLASQSITFQGLLDCLYHGLISSKGSHAGFQEAEKTVSDLLAIRDDLKSIFESNVSDVKEAETYILSNIVLSNKMPNSPNFTQIENLKMIIHSFLNQEVGQRSPEFYLLVLLLFWPQRLVVQEEEEVEEEKGQTTENDGSNEDNTWEDRESKEDDEQETWGEMAQSPALDSFMDFDLNKYVAFMKNAFEKNYAKYLRSRYLLPLFFLGRGDGLSRWVHKSKLDEILEGKAKEDEELQNKKQERKEIWNQINEMWSSGQVWKIQEIQDILLPINGEDCSVNMLEKHAESEVFACMGGRRIKVGVEDDLNASFLDQTFVFYLGFTIKGPVAFNMGPPCV